MPDPVGWYDANAASLADSYEALRPDLLHAWLEGLYPPAPALMLDVGAGSGRDAAWLAGLGHDVVAVEPASGLRAEAARRHTGAAVRWMADQLPALPATLRLGLAFDVILLSAVWQHVLPADRPRALRKLLGLLRPGGVLAVTLRYGPVELDRPMHPVSLTELETLARQLGAIVVRVQPLADAMGRPEVNWTGVALRLPDDGTGALPLLRHLILNDQKAASYKLGLLRALCRAADGQAGMVVAEDDDKIVLPLGLIALDWLRLYLPLVTAKLPQMPGNARPGQAGLCRAGFPVAAGRAGAAARAAGERSLWW